jgi:hypothetical protein
MLASRPAVAVIALELVWIGAPTFDSSGKTPEFFKNKKC